MRNKKPLMLKTYHLTCVGCDANYKPLSKLVLGHDTRICPDCHNTLETTRKLRINIKHQQAGPQNLTLSSDGLIALEDIMEEKPNAINEN